MMEKEKKEIEKIVLSYLNKKTFSACALGVSCLRTDIFDTLDIFQGNTDKEKKGEEVNEKSYFDVASLTKPLVTVLSVLSLIKEKKIRFEETLETLLPFNVPEDKKNISLIQLLGHRSGFPSHRKYYLKQTTLSEYLDSAVLINMILREKLENMPGLAYLYSDLDYLVLGEIVKWKSGESIDDYWRKKITEPLGISSEFYSYGVEKKRNFSFVGTGKCNWSDTPLRGVVHDDNCRALGTIQGHAGLFATLKGIKALCEDILLSYLGVRNNPSYERKDLLFLLKRRKKRQWAYGFDVVTGSRPSTGKYFSKRTIGHLGFTGTSFWIDLEKQIIVVLLTNRVIYGEDKILIKEIRPLLHDAVMKALGRA
jgi:CubicO group peptidase (beta-lactamase class C family)